MLITAHTFCRLEVMLYYLMLNKSCCCCCIKRDLQHVYYSVDSDIFKIMCFPTKWFAIVFVNKCYELRLSTQCQSHNIFCTSKEYLIFSGHKPDTFCVVSRQSTSYYNVCILQVNDECLGKYPLYKNIFKARLEKGWLWVKWILY